MNEIIYKYEDEDLDYFQLLLTITDTLPPEDLKKFSKLLKSAELDNKKVYIHRDDAEMIWDSLTIDQIKIE